MVDKLSTWLNSELKQRGWSHRELARRAGISGAMVSAVIAGDRNAGWGFCEAIAKPLGKAPIEVFRIAGLMPPEPTGYDEAGLLHRYRRLTPEQQQTVVAMLGGLAGEQPPPIEIHDIAVEDKWQKLRRILANLPADEREILITSLIEKYGPAGALDDPPAQFRLPLRPAEVTRVEGATGVLK